MTVGLAIFSIRSVDDCGAARALAETHARYERSSVILPSDWAERVAGMIAADKVRVFLALRGGVPVGYASVTLVAATWSAGFYAELDCLFVVEDWRGTGLGSALIEAASAQARDDGCRELQWQTPAWNADAIRFYERLGARHTTKERFTLDVALT